MFCLISESQKCMLRQRENEGIDDRVRNVGYFKMHILCAIMMSIKKVREGLHEISRLIAKR